MMHASNAHGGTRDQCRDQDDPRCLSVVNGPSNANRQSRKGKDDVVIEDVGADQEWRRQSSSLEHGILARNGVAARQEPTVHGHHGENRKQKRGHSGQPDRLQGSRYRNVRERRARKETDQVCAQEGGRSSFEVILGDQVHHERMAKSSTQRRDHEHGERQGIPKEQTLGKATTSSWNQHEDQGRQEDRLQAQGGAQHDASEEGPVGLQCKHSQAREPEDDEVGLPGNEVLHKRRGTCDGDQDCHCRIRHWSKQLDPDDCSRRKPERVQEKPELGVCAARDMRTPTRECQIRRRVDEWKGRSSGVEHGTITQMFLHIR